MHAERLKTAAWKRVARARNARFSTQLRVDRDAPALLLSPHLDDAVIDCWSVLTAAEDVEVVNVFALAPPPGTNTDWDRAIGFKDSALLFASRLAEDAEALALAGREPHNLPFLELQYRRGKRIPGWAEIDAAITARVPAASHVFAPLSLVVVHPDHRLLREYATALARQGLPVTLYADSPYCTQHGWPAWVSGEQAPENLDVEAMWAPSFDGLPVEQRAGRVVKLDEAARAAKLAAMRTYRTQFPSLDRGPVGQLSNPAIHGFEVFWDL
jgi:LmbE family N-acetylglucosaminyl deacetylase